MLPKDNNFEKAKEALATALHQELSKKTDYLTLQQKMFDEQKKYAAHENQRELLKPKESMRNLSR